MAHEKDANLVFDHAVLVDNNDDRNISILENFTYLLRVASGDESNLDLDFVVLLLHPD
jgi:hypothetical protein